MDALHLAGLKIAFITEELMPQLEEAQDGDYEDRAAEVQRLITQVRLAYSFVDLVQVMVDCAWDFGGAVSFMMFTLCPEAKLDMEDVNAFQRAAWST